MKLCELLGTAASHHGDLAGAQVLHGAGYPEATGNLDRRPAKANALDPPRNHETLRLHVKAPFKKVYIYHTAVVPVCLGIW